MVCVPGNLAAERARPKKDGLHGFALVGTRQSTPLQAQRRRLGAVAARYAHHVYRGRCVSPGETQAVPRAPDIFGSTLTRPAIISEETSRDILVISFAIPKLTVLRVLCN